MKPPTPVDALAETHVLVATSPVANGDDETVQLRTLSPEEVSRRSGECRDTEPPAPRPPET